MKASDGLSITRKQSQVRTLFSEGWPETNPMGRKLGVQRIEVAVRHDLSEVLEEGRVVFASESAPVPFKEAHVYLQMTSRGNFPSRAISFDNFVVTGGP